MLFNEALSKLLTPEEQEKFHHIRKRIKDIDRVKIAIMQSLVENTEEPYNKPLGVYFDSPRLVRLREYRSKLDEQLDELQNIALCRLSGNNAYKHDFSEDISDITFSNFPEDREIVLNAINSFSDMLNTIPDPPEGYQDNNRLQIKRGSMTVQEPKEPITSKNRPDLSYSEKLALVVSEHYLEMFPEQADLYTRLPGETLSEYVDRISNALDKATLEPVVYEALKVEQAEKLDIPVDKVNSRIWGVLKNTPDGQIGFVDMDLIVGDTKKGIDPVVSYYVDFNGLPDITIAKELTEFDKRVYIGIAALFNVGNNCVSLSQIAKTIGYTSTPQQTTLNNIRKSINKLAFTKLKIDNLSETKVYKNYPHFKYESSFLPVEWVSVEINGKITDSAIHIFREPPLVTYAREHKQITTINVKLLQSPINKTESSIALEHYLIESIQHMKKGKLCNRMLFDTIYKHVGTTEKKQKQRTKDKLQKLLDYYKTQSFITNYKLDDKGVDIIY